MKTLHHIQRTIFVLLVVTAVISCKKHHDDPIDQTKKVTVQLSGANEVPAVSTTGTGTAAISYDPATMMITYTLTWQLGSTTSTTTGMHFHGAEDGSDTKSSPIIIGITGFTTSYSGTISSTTRALSKQHVHLAPQKKRSCLLENGMLMSIVQSIPMEK
jgi:hypothetical protein